MVCGVAGPLTWAINGHGKPSTAILNSASVLLKVSFEEEEEEKLNLDCNFIALA